MKLSRIWERTGMLLVCVVLFAALWLFVPHFGTWPNIQTLLSLVATIGMIACTMLFCLAAGDFDLSIGSTVAFAGVIAAMVLGKTNNPYLATGAAIAMGSVIGWVNGFVIAKVGINALITTLATMQIVRGAALILSNGSSIGISNESFGALGQSTYGIGGYQLASPVWIMILCFVVFGLLLNRTVFGRNALAIGGNLEAARLAGVRVARTKIVIFTLQGIVAAFAGVVVASRVTSGQPNTNVGLELQVISACVLGGVSLTGGLGTITGVIVGVLIMGAVQDALNLLNIPPFYQSVASGVILLMAVMIDRLKSRGRKA